MRRINLLILVLALVLLAYCGACSPVLNNPVTPASVSLTVYFTNITRFQAGTEPYEAAVTRLVAPVPSSLPEAVLTQLFLGPTKDEQARGLAFFPSGTTGFSKLTIENGIARIQLTGSCASHGSTYTIANLIFANLKQFPEIQAVKIYDQHNETETPNGQNDSIPICLEP